MMHKLGLAALACMMSWGVADAASTKTRSGSRADSSATKPAGPAGPLQIVVSLGQQRVTVFDAGVPIMSAAVSSGQSGHETPAGIYTILQKNRHHESNIYSGAPMPFMQRITWSGIALHEGNLPGYPASHGCIRLPGSFASALFGVTKIGARVIVARDPLTPRAFAHDKLFKPEQQPVAVSALPQGDAGTGQARPTGVIQEASAGGGFLVGSAAASSLEPTPAGTAAASSDRPTIPEAPVTATRADRNRAKAQTESLVSVLVSRQTGRIYIRQNFEPLHEAPITIQDSDLPLGTHLYTAVGYNADKTQLTWNVVTYPMEGGHQVAQVTSRSRMSDADRADAVAGVTRRWVTPPGAALERVDFGEEINDMLSEVARPGMSLIVTDKGPGPETGKGTEFVIQPR